MPTASPSRLEPSGAPVLVLALLLAGCGPADSAAPGTAAPNTNSAVPSLALAATATASPAPSTEDISWNGSGPSFGVDRAEWPGTVKGARTLLTSLPKELSDFRLELNVDPRDDSPSATYGKLGTVFIQTEEDREMTEKLTAKQLLLAGFGLGAVCAKGTYRGTAAVPILTEGEEEPSLSKEAPGVEAGSTPAWFSCQPITEDDEWGHAVGWTSGETAWQLYARDEKAARRLVTALHGAAR